MTRAAFVPVVAVVVAISLASGAGASTTEVAAAAPAADAISTSIPYDPARFDRGSIISDALFYDANAMTVAEIQSFLNTRGSGCTSSAQSADCLKDLRTHVTARSANANCGAISGASSRSAAQIIYDVQRACGISAKVLLVTLQKEQGLVTTSSPTSRAYQIAMGYGCPDSAACDEQYYGFSNQVYRAAWQFTRYATAESSFRFRAGGTYNIATSPNCPSTTIRVTIANKATAGLYNYTPYTPNDAALAAYPGGGVACGAYGNRNFFAFYSQWFGNPNLSTPVVRYAGYSHWWILVGGESWRIHGAATDLKQEAQVLAREATVAQSYVESFDEQGFFKGVFRDTSGTYFLADNRRRLSLGTCAAAMESGFDCAPVPTFTTEQRNLYSNAGNLGNLIIDTDGHSWYLADGQRREVLDASLLTNAGVQITSAVRLQRASSLDSVEVGQPFVTPGTLVESDAVGSDWYYFDGSRVYVVPKWLRLETSIRSWLGESQGTLTAQSIARLGSPEDLPLAMRNGASTAFFLMTPDGIANVSDPSEWPFDFSVIGFATLDRIPRVDDAESVTFVSRAGASRSGSWIEGTVLSWYQEGQRRPIWSAQHEQLQIRSSGADSNLYLVSQLFDEVPKGNLLVPSGAVIRAQGFTAKMFIDGDLRHHVFTETHQEITRASILDVPERVLKRYEYVPGRVTIGLRCGDDLYLAVSKKLRPIDETTAAQYMPVVTFDDYGPETCAALEHDERPATSILLSDSTYWQVSDGTRMAITRVQYDQLRVEYGSAMGVSANFLRLIPIADQ